ncbi:MAG: histidine phosphatase family protein [Candidatus Saccharimonadales bacterium]
MRLILIRHAETIENRRGIIQGQRPGRISEFGKQQIATIKDTIKHEKIEAIYTSDLQRCIETAEPLHQFYNKAPFIISSELREFSYGKLQGIPLGRFIKLVPKNGLFMHIKLPGSESYKQVRTRLIIFLNQLYKSYPNSTVLLITHGGPIRLMRILLDENIKLTTPQTINNCSIWKLDMDNPIKST